MTIERIVTIIIILLIAFGVYVLAVQGDGVFHSLFWKVNGMSEEMSERQTGTPQARFGAWIRDEQGSWSYTARPERYDQEEMHTIPHHIAKGD